MNERELIAKLRPLAGPAGLNLDDDAALIDIPAGHQLVMSTDTMVEGVHFPNGRIGGDFAERLLRTALSDLAAKAARPIGYSLNLTWPVGRDTRFVDGFIVGLREAQEAFDCPLIGGDTTSGEGPLVACATVYGVVPTGKMVTRCGAKVGDRVFHTGELGWSEKGLRLALGEAGKLSAPDRLKAEEAYLRPVPRLLFRKVLRDFATACADISDGVVSDAGHIAKASGVCIDLTEDVIQAGSHGDDYELLFTVPEATILEMRKRADAIGLSVTQCGLVLEGKGVSQDGKTIDPNISGYRHSF